MHNCPTPGRKSLEDAQVTFHFCLLFSLSTLGKTCRFFYDRKRLRRAGLFSTEMAPSQGGAGCFNIGNCEICRQYIWALPVRNLPNQLSHGRIIILTIMEIYLNTRFQMTFMGQVRYQCLSGIPHFPAGGAVPRRMRHIIGVMWMFLLLWHYDNWCQTAFHEVSNFHWCFDICACVCVCAYVSKAVRMRSFFGTLTLTPKAWPCVVNLTQATDFIVECFLRPGDLLSNLCWTNSPWAFLESMDQSPMF